MSTTRTADDLHRRPLHRVEYEALGRRGGVPDYWVVDVGRGEIVVHRDPAGTTFRSITCGSSGAWWPATRA